MAGRSKKLVLDSSVIVKWFTKEDGSESALRILDSLGANSISVSISELSFYELANALRYKPDFSSQDVIRCVSKLQDLELEVVKLDDIVLTESSEIAFDCKITFYDAVPVAIAKLGKARCVTADIRTQFIPVSQRGYPVTLLERAVPKQT